MSAKTVAQLRTQQELMLSLGLDDAYAGSSTELADIQEGYQATADSHDFPQLLVRRGIVIVANVNRYSLPTGFRKARTVKVLVITYDETELENLEGSRYKYAIDRENSEIVLSQIPSTASPAFTLSNAESAGNAVVIELDTTTGLSQYDEIFIDSASGTDEFSLVSSVSAGVSITARLRAAKSASDILYRVKEIIDIEMYRSVPTLSLETETLLLPDAFDFVTLFYSAHMAYLHLEEWDNADKYLKLWREKVAEAWLAWDKSSTGTVTQFSI